MTGLCDYPHEVIGEIVKLLDCPTAKALRLSCRTVETGSRYQFGREFCQNKNVHFRDAEMDVASVIPGFTLDDLRWLANTKDFCDAVKRLNFTPIHLMHLTGLAIYQGLTGDSGEISDLANVRQWGFICTHKLGNMHNRIKNLAEIFRQLSSLEEVSISDVIKIRLNRISLANDEGVIIGAIVKAILHAVSKSGKQLKSLEMIKYEEAVHKGGIDVRDLYVLQPNSITFGLLRTLSLVITNGCVYTGSNGIFRGYEAWEYLPSFLSKAPNLEELRLEMGWATWYENFIYLFKAMAKSAVLPSLKTLHLDRAVLNQKDMTAFVETHKDSLENPSLSRVWVRSDEDPSSFWVLCRDLRDKLNLKTLSIMDSGVDEGNIFFENLSYNLVLENVTDELGEDGWALVHWADTDDEVNIDESLNFKTAMTELINCIIVMANWWNSTREAFLLSCF